MPLTHHDLCFGCGQANLFGLQLELERRDDGSVTGRFFLKQDHQGRPGQAHDGVLAAALCEAIALLTDPAGVSRVELDLGEPAPVGTFVRIEAEAEPGGGDEHWVTAAAHAEDGNDLLARARARVAPRVA